MNRATATTALGALAMLTACATPTAPRASAAAPGVQCDATALLGLVGRPAAEVTARAKRLSGARSVRSYATGDMLTMDLRADRLNVEHDAAGKVVRFHCG